MDKIYTYDVDGLMGLMKPFKISTEEIKPNTKDKSVFISISRGYPNTRITMEYCNRKNKYGDIITMSDHIYKLCIPGLYKYCQETIEIITNWQYGHNLILEIEKELIEMNIKDIDLVKDYINELKEINRIDEVKRTLNFKIQEV